MYLKSPDKLYQEMITEGTITKEQCTRTQFFDALVEQNFIYKCPFLKRYRITDDALDDEWLVYGEEEVKHKDCSVPVKPYYVTEKGKEIIYELITGLIDSGSLASAHSRKRIFLDDEEKKFVDLCENISRYWLRQSPNTLFPRYLEKELKKLISENDIDIIVFACDLASKQIQDYFHKNVINVKSELHRCNLILLFVKKQIDRAKLKIEKRKVANERLLNMDCSNQFAEMADYIPRSRETDEMLEEYW